MTASRDVASPLVNAAMGFMGRARFDYRLSDREVLFTSIESFEQNQNAYVQAPLSRNRFMVGVQISLSSETDRRQNHMNEDAAYVALTDHQRRRTTPQ
jgi:alpha-beta hydrolase superfamily lysophospholipase